MKPIKTTSLVRGSARAITASVLLTAVSFAGSMPYSRIVVFGDSLSDTGNASFLTGGAFPPPAFYADGKMSNGAIWVEHLADSLGMELQPEDQYAVIGATSGLDNFAAISNGIPPLMGTGLQWQIETFLTDSGPGGVDSDALYIVWIGANDIFLYPPENIAETMSSAIQNTAEAVYTLAMNGARHILVANLPDLGLTPWGLDQGPAASATLTYLTGVYNLYLGSALDSLAANGIPTIRFDAAGLISEVAADPESFGLEDATHRAGVYPGDDDVFLFWDDVHPTTVGHRIVADRVVQDLVAYYSPRRGRGKGPGLVNSLNGLTKVRR